jgi:hypothetical protein
MAARKIVVNISILNNINSIQFVVYFDWINIPVIIIIII